MKRMKLLVLTLMLSLTVQFCHANIFGLTVKVSVSSRSYWDGTGCVPRDQGGCVHIEVGGIVLKNTGGILTFEAPADIMKNPAYRDMFADGYFYVGPITIEQRALDQIKFPGNSTFPDKRYAVKVDRGNIVIQLN